MNDVQHIGSWKLIYLCRARIPSRKAHVTQIHKMCDAFLEQDVELELIHPFRWSTFEPPSSSTKEYYGLRNTIPDRTLPSLDIPFLQNISINLWFWVYATTYVISVLLSVCWTRLFKGKEFIIYSRDRISTLALLLFNPLLNIPMYFEMHDRPGSLGGPGGFLWRRLDGVVTISHNLKKEIRKARFPAERITVEHDGVDLSQFADLPSKSRLRKDLQIPCNDLLVGYTGHLYPWKGSELILELAERTPDIRYITVGGTPEDVTTFKKKAVQRKLDNLTILGHQPQRTIPRYLKCFDILLLPTSGQGKQPTHYTSPLKLFEYMAAQRPIVASKLPSIEEILTDEQNALLAQPDDADDFRHQILRIKTHPELAETIARQARKHVKEYTWDQRAKRILRFIRATISEKCDYSEDGA